MLQDEGHMQYVILSDNDVLRDVTCDITQCVVMWESVNGLNY